MQENISILEKKIQVYICATTSVSYSINLKDSLRSEPILLLQ